VICIGPANEAAKVKTQEDGRMNNLQRFRERKDEFFRYDHHSPLTPQQREEFEGLKYFPENPDLDLVVDVAEFPDKKTVRIQTTTGDVQNYERYGHFHFQVDGEEGELTLYRDEGGFFLPFADALAGKETYGAGRYLEPDQLPDGRFEVDFNLAYNPYCAYNENYSCPITPAENRIKVAIRAGEKVYKPD
jgi:uncharacterized protein (DUF1684 family)